MSNPLPDPQSALAARLAALSAMSDAELAGEMQKEAAAGGADGLAWRTFQLRHGERLLRFISSRMQGASTDEREDIYSETVSERMLDGIDDFNVDNGASLLGWACTIASRIIIDKWRARGRAAAPVFVSVDDVAESLGIATDDDEPTPESAQAADMLEKAFRQLSPRDQAVLELSRCGLEEDAIGQQLRISGPHVRRVRYRALDRLEKLLRRAREAVVSSSTASGD